MQSSLRCAIFPRVIFVSLFLRPDVNFGAYCIFDFQITKIAAKIEFCRIILQKLIIASFTIETRSETPRNSQKGSILLLIALLTKPLVFKTTSYRHIILVALCVVFSKSNWRLVLFKKRRYILCMNFAASSACWYWYSISFSLWLWLSSLTLLFTLRTFITYLDHQIHAEQIIMCLWHFVALN